MFNFDDASKKGKETVDTVLKGYSELAKGFQAIAAESAEYTKKSFQDAVSHAEALAGVKSVETAFELQSTYVKTAYESFVAEATKINELYADLARSVYKPYEFSPVRPSTALTPAA